MKHFLRVGIQVEGKLPPALLMANLCCIQLRVAMKHFPLVVCHLCSSPKNLSSQPKFFFSFLTISQCFFSVPDESLRFPLQHMEGCRCFQKFINFKIISHLYIRSVFRNRIPIVTTAKPNAVIKVTNCCMVISNLYLCKTYLLNY